MLKYLFIFLLCLTGLGAMAQAPGIQRNRYSTNADGVAVAVLSTTNGNVVLKYTNGNVVYVDANGSDTTGVRGVPSLAATTISNAAFNLALAGDTVVVNNGLYTNNNLLASNVNYLLFPGVSQVYVQPGGDVAAKGLFDDRSLTNGTTNIIVFDSIFFQGYTNRATNSARNFNINSEGAIAQTNVNSRMYVRGRSIKIDSVSNLGLLSGVSQQLGTNAYMDIHLDELIDPYFGTTMVMSNTGIGGATIAAGRAGYGLYWGEGNMHANITRLQVSGNYGIWGNGQNAVTTNDLYYTGDDFLSPIYMSPASTNYVSWINFKQHKVTSANSGTGIAETFFGGKNYVTAQKIEGNNMAVNVAGNTSFNWVSTLKAAANSQSWVNCSTGYTWMASMDFEDLGAIQSGFNLSGGYSFFGAGGDAKVSNGKGILFRGGTSIFDGQHIDTSATDSTNNNPVFVTANGLVLHDVVLTSPASAYSISATTAQTVKIEGVLTRNGALSPNITLTGDTNDIVNLSAHGPAVFDSSVGAAGAMSVSGNITNANGVMAANLPVVTGSGTNLTTRLLTPADMTAQYTAHLSSGTYSFTATPALLFPGSPAQFSLTASGTWIIFAGVNVRYNAATFPAGRTLNIRLRKTSGTPVNLSGSDSVLTIRTITTTTDEAGYYTTPPYIYSGNFGDVIQLWGEVSVLPTAGSIDGDASYITAYQIN